MALKLNILSQILTIFATKIKGLIQILVQKMGQIWCNQKPNHLTFKWLGLKLSGWVDYSPSARDRKGRASHKTKPRDFVPVFAFQPPLQKCAFDGWLKRKNHHRFRNGGFILLSGWVDYLLLRNSWSGWGVSNITKSRHCVPLFAFSPTLQKQASDVR